MIQESETFKMEDELIKETIEIRSELETLLYQTKSQIEKKKQKIN